MSEKVYTLKEIADRWRCHPETLRRLAEKNEIPMFRVGHQWRMREDELVDFEQRDREKTEN